MSRRILISFCLLAIPTLLCAQSSPAGFVISGKTVNIVTGQLLPGTEVFLYKTNPADAEYIDPAPQRILTGEDGRFTFHVSQPGKYLLAGQRNGFKRQGYEQHGFYFSAAVVGPGKDSGNLVFRLSPDSRIAGTIVAEDHESVAGALVYLFRTDASGGLRKTYLLGQTSTDDRGHYHFPHLAWGWYSLVVMAEPWWSSLARGQGYTTNQYKQDAAFNLIYSTVFYPGVTDPASASQIALTEGQDFTADFTLAPTASPTLRLLHFNKDPGLMRRAILKQKLFGAEIEIPMQRQIAVDDSVEISGVPPTQYILEVDSFRPGSVSRAVTLDLTSDTEFDMDGTPSLSPIKGTILVAAEHSLPVQASIRLWNSRTGELLESAIGPKGEFSLDAHSATPGSYSVFVGNIENSLIEKITAVGARVVGQTVEIRGAKPVQLNITLSHGWSTINGTAMHEGKLMAGAMILLVPDDPEINLPLFRRDQSDSDGTFTLRNVLPGRYRMLALDNAWDAEWANPALLKGRLDHVQSVDVQPNRIYNSVINVE